MIAMCYCQTCGRSFHYLGIARHRAMHRDRRERCVIEYSDGSVYEYEYDLPDYARELSTADDGKTTYPTWPVKGPNDEAIE